MEPEEAVDALRDMSAQEREQLLGQMTPDVSEHLSGLLRYSEDRAGGVMTTTIVLCSEQETVAQVADRLRAMVEHAVDLDAVIIIDTDGRLLDDVTVLELLLTDPQTRLSELVGPPWPVTVRPDTPVREVAIALIENRSASIVVVDTDGRPLGRTLADDIVDALISLRSRLQVFRQGPA